MPTATTWTCGLPAEWLSGVYLGRLTTVPDEADQPYWQSYVTFIVRDTRRADVLFQSSDNTAQAYNRWPVNESLYTDPRGAHARDVAVSFDRPYGRQAQYTGIVNDPLSVGSGEFLSFEQPLAYFLEEHGDDVIYCSNSDCLAASQTTRCKVFLSVGHDEYWDLRQYQATKAAIEAGVSVLWLSGNSVFAVSTFSNSADGRPNRIITRTGHFGGFTDEDFKAAEGIMTSRNNCPDSPWRKLPACGRSWPRKLEAYPTSFSNGAESSVVRRPRFQSASMTRRQRSGTPRQACW